MATIAALVGAGVTAYGAYSCSQNQKKAQESQSHALDGVELGEKPKAAEYKPVDFNREQMNTVMGNFMNLQPLTKLMNRTNSIIDTDALARARRFIPNYEMNMKLQGQHSTDLLNGRLPYDDVLDIAANRSGLSGSLGVPGVNAPATLRDLGLSRMDAIRSGTSMMNNMVQIAQTVNPVERRMRPQDMFLTPEARIRMAMEQNQIIQQSDQNRNNIEAGVSPTQAAQAQLALGGALAPPVGSPIGAYGSAAASAISALGGAFSTGGGGGAGVMNYSSSIDPGLYSTGGGGYLTRGYSSAPTSSIGYRPANLPSDFYAPYSIKAS